MDHLYDGGPRQQLGVRVASKRSIVIITVSGLSAKWLELAQRGVATTPNLDRLRDQGVTFTRCFSSTPQSSPARATIATGLAAPGHGVLSDGYTLDPGLPTFAQILRDHGWATGAFGKMHLVPQASNFYPDYGPYGFDTAHITEDTRGGEWLDCIRYNYPDHFEAALSTVWAHKLPGFQVYGPEEEDLMTRIVNVRRRCNWQARDYPGSGPNHHVLPFPEEISQTSWITAHALDFIYGTPADQPLLAHIGYVQPRAPYTAPALFLDSVKADRIPDPVKATWAEDPRVPEEFKRRRPHQPQAWRFHRQLYFADIVHLDQQLGWIFNALVETRRLNDTYILFMADHGDMLYEHGLTGAGEKHYDTAIRVPLMVTGPTLRMGIVCDSVVQLEDICPTILDFAGLEMPPLPVLGDSVRVPSGGLPVLPGHTLVALLRGETLGAWRNAVCIRTNNSSEQVRPEQWARTVRSHAYRYTLYGDGGEQLFDLRTDPNEQHNRAGDRDCASIRDELRARLLSLLIGQEYPHTRRDLYALGAW